MNGDFMRSVLVSLVCLLHNIDFLEEGKELLEYWMEELVNHKNERLNLD